MVPSSLLLLCIVLKILATPIGEKNKRHRNTKGGSQMISFAGNKILYIENLKVSTKRLFKLIN
jgi:hypothetical protein